METDLQPAGFQKQKPPLVQVRLCRLFPDLRAGRFFLAMELHRNFPYTNGDNRKGESKTVTLPDGSLVRLNPSSEIAFQQAFEDTIRRVRLKGEAWFNVVHHADKPFIVNAPNLTTRVLGTRFCVDDYPEDGQAAVYLQTGSVEVNPAESFHSHVLHPGEYWVYDKTTHQIHISARKPPYLYFRNASLEEIRHSLERKFNIPIKLEGVSEEKYTLEFDSTATVREVLETLCVLDEHLTWRTGHNHTIILSIKHE